MKGREIKGEGKCEDKEDSFAVVCLAQAMLLLVKLGSPNLPPSLRHPLQRFPRIMAIQGSRNIYTNYHQGEITCSVEQIFPHDHIKRAKIVLY